MMTWKLEHTGGNCTAMQADAGNGRTWLIVTSSDASAPTHDNDECELYRVGPDGEGQDEPLSFGSYASLREHAELAEVQAWGRE